MPDLALARKVLRDRSRRNPRLDRPRSTSDSSARWRCSRDCRGRVIVTGMGKSGIICRKIAATLASTGTPAFFLHPAEAIHGDLGVDAGRRRRRRAVAQRRDRRRSCACSRPSGASARRIIAMTGHAGIDPRPVRRRRARLPRRRGGVPAEPGADGQHHGGAGAGRRAGDDAARAKRGSAPRTSPTCTPAASSASGSCAWSS